MIRDGLGVIRRPMLPERDTSAPANAQGLFRKYIVKRTDGQDEDLLNKHFNCEYFVLDLTHDPAARAALKAYVQAIVDTHPTLAEDIVIRYLGGET